MKNLLFLLLIALSLACNTPNTKSETTTKTDSTANQEVRGQALLDKWGADQMGMKTYVMAFLKSGPNRSQDSTTTAQIQKGHMDNINRMAEEGKLLVAGPFMDNGELRGIYIFDVRTVEEAEQLTNTDPAIQAGRLVMELHPWYGPGALMALPELYNRSIESE